MKSKDYIMKKFTCHKCGKEYKSKRWFEFHLSQHEPKVKIIEIVAIISFIIAIGIWVLYYPPFEVYNRYILGPDMDIRFYDEIEYIDGSPTVVVDVENTGGVTLHNLIAYLDYSCGDINYVGEKVSGRFKEGPFEMKKGDIRPFYFSDENILKYHEGNIGCYDAIQYYYILDENRHPISKYKYEFNNAENKVNCYNITNKEDSNLSKICEYCKVDIVISSDEKNNSKNTIFPYVAWEAGGFAFRNFLEKVETVPEILPGREAQLVLYDTGNPMCQNYTEKSGTNTCAGFVVRSIYKLHYSKYNFSKCL